mmetsp:Transcript_84476/g.236448  ORF Transcript_84476/g.236448 Transcript_84476/m.236448 type:complete len:502 (+) Transcript_84476:1456-2961(+)
MTRLVAAQEAVSGEVPGLVGLGVRGLALPLRHRAAALPFRPAVHAHAGEAADEAPFRCVVPLLVLREVRVRKLAIVHDDREAVGGRRRPHHVDAKAVALVPDEAALGVVGEEGLEELRGGPRQRAHPVVERAGLAIGHGVVGAGREEFRLRPSEGVARDRDLGAMPRQPVDGLAVVDAGDHAHELRPESLVRRTEAAELGGRKVQVRQPVLGVVEFRTLEDQHTLQGRLVLVHHHVVPEAVGERVHGPDRCYGQFPVRPVVLEAEPEQAAGGPLVGGRVGAGDHPPAPFHHHSLQLSAVVAEDQTRHHVRPLNLLLLRKVGVVLRNLEPAIRHGGVLLDEELEVVGGGGHLGRGGELVQVGLNRAGVDHVPVEPPEVVPLRRVHQAHGVVREELTGAHRIDPHVVRAGRHVVHEAVLVHEVEDRGDGVALHKHRVCGLDVLWRLRDDSKPGHASVRTLRVEDAGERRRGRAKCVQLRHARRGARHGPVLRLHHDVRRPGLN